MYTIKDNTKFLKTYVNYNKKQVAFNGSLKQTSFKNIILLIILYSIHKTYISIHEERHI